MDDPRQADVTACGETLEVVRKKALLRVLARREAAHSGVAVDQAAIDVTEANFRTAFGLADDDELRRWREANGVTAEAFALAMSDFALIARLEDVLAAEVDKLVPDHIAVATARVRPLQSVAEGV